MQRIDQKRLDPQSAFRINKSVTIEELNWPRGTSACHP
jgi:hypothetical protein